ncbi:hypothetical protein [Undibacterium sp. Di24W]|uniref:hypothetical protein n=1 Tax=Undibacterium sp. Di24W TaxID=3413033 RepID=UPI003BF3F366
MISVTEFRSATPILASLDIARTVAFYETKLGFTTLYSAQNEYAVLRKDSIGLHKCTLHYTTEAIWTE